MVSSWNELTSTVSTSYLIFSRATSESGFPMLPQAIVFWPQWFSIWASISVVVVFPLVPVIAITGVWHDCHPSSSSPIMSVPRDQKFRPSAEAGSIPGLATTRSNLSELRSASGPQTTRIPWAARLSRVDRNSLSSCALSSTVTLAPSDCRRSAAAAPLKPAPRTAACWFE